MSDRPIIAVAGATGAVGVEMLSILEERALPHGELRLLASQRSAGQAVTYRGEEHVIRQLNDDTLAGVDIALFSAGGSISKQFAPIAADSGTVIVDNSSAFRMEAASPLVVPEINASSMQTVRPSSMGGGGGIIANPNCSTIIMLVPLNAIRQVFGITRIVVSTYQAASGAGAAGMRELEESTRAYFEGREHPPSVFGEAYAFNLFSHDSAVDPVTGRNVEEQKMLNETRKIWNDESVEISATCIRVPVLRTHAETINITLAEPASANQIRDLLSQAPGVTVLDDRAQNRFPSPRRSSGADDVLVGRIRADGRDAHDDDTPTYGIDLFVCGDQLRKGAALNAVQIAELVMNA